METHVNDSQLPTNTTSRIVTIDVLRGFALFGILYSHMFLWYTAGPLPQSIFESQHSFLNILVGSIYGVFFTAKFFSIFSFLFGMSFFIQLEALERKGDNPALRFAWRLAILAVIGILHHLFWRGDILSIYAPLGFVLIFSRQLSTKTLFIMSSILVLNIPTLIAQLIFLITTGSYSFFPPEGDAAGIHYLDVVQHANFMEMVRDNFYSTQEKIHYQLETGRLLMTYGYFLLGMLVARLGWIHDLNNHSVRILNFWRKSWKIMAVLLVIAIVLGVTFKIMGIELKDNFKAQYPFIILMNLFNTALTVFYIFGICLLMTQAKWIKRLSPLSYIGKMALTSYITQSIVGVTLFFGLGFGLIGKTSMAENVVIGVIIFGLQILFSRWWLSHFIYGPIEWLWRSATYLKWQPFIKAHESHI